MVNIVFVLFIARSLFTSYEMRYGDGTLVTDTVSPHGEEVPFSLHSAMMSQGQEQYGRITWYLVESGITIINDI